MKGKTIDLEDDGITPFFQTQTEKERKKLSREKVYVYTRSFMGIEWLSNTKLSVRIANEILNESGVKLPQ